MNIFSMISSYRPSRRTSLIALLLVAPFLAFVAYERLVVAPKRQQVIRRYDEFRAVVATGDANRMLQFVAPEMRQWAADRLHLYKMFARPLDDRSTVWLFSGEATIYPKPDRHYLVIPGGHVIKMMSMKESGSWDGFISTERNQRRPIFLLPPPKTPTHG